MCSMEAGRRTKNAVSHQPCFASAACLMLTLITGEPQCAQSHDLITLRTANGAAGSKVASRTANLSYFLLCNRSLAESHQQVFRSHAKWRSRSVSRSRNSLRRPVVKSAQQAIRTYSHDTMHQYRSQIQQREVSTQFQHQNLSET